jgi:hydroxymethylglutaryl-CoA reductase
MNGEIINGFSRLSKNEKINCISALLGDEGFADEAISYAHPEKQELFDSFSENTLTNFVLPFGVAPNFLINGKVYHIPMVVEESSVVAAASAAAKFWSTRGGFQTKIISTTKKGHVHFLWFGEPEVLIDSFSAIKEKLIDGTLHLTSRMRERGGGITEIKLENYSSRLNGYYRLAVDFETADSMGANFINTVLEAMADILRSFVHENFAGNEEKLEVIMSILSNHVPECVVECSVSCGLSQLDKIDGETPASIFAKKFKTAVDIACLDPYRAATHNKGIMNGIDSVVIATGNDFRAVEAGAHTFASLDGYKSLSKVGIENDTFTFSLKIPLAVGTVGGLTALHPMAKRAMQILGNPSARELMTIIAAAGLANNFSAVKALVTKGIQQGHMKMHLSNMLIPYNLEADKKKMVENYFQSRPVSFAAVSDYVKQLKSINS